MTSKKIAVFAVAVTVSLPSLCLGGFLAKNSKGIAETRYCGASNLVEASETIAYARKETTSSYSMKGDVPNYNGYINASNCANVAGAELIGYYDRFYENLIPNYKSYVQVGPAIVYRPAGAETADVMVALKSYMGTQEGTTFKGFHNGMKTYVESHSYSYNTEDLGNLNLDKYKNAVENNKPVALFLSNYSFYLSAQKTDNGEILKSEHSGVAHVVIGCGYKIDTYYDSNGRVITTRTYLKVASGFDLRGLVYLCLDGKSSIDRATSVIIS